MKQNHRRQERRTLVCSLCGQAITIGEEYWYCNGASVCRCCLNDFARAELAPYRQTRGKEVLP